MYFPNNMTHTIPRNRIFFTAKRAVEGGFIERKGAVSGLTRRRTLAKRPRTRYNGENFREA